MHHHRLAVLALCLCVGACSSDPDGESPDAGQTDMGTDDVSNRQDASDNVADASTGADAGTFDCFGQTCAIGAEYCPGTYCSGDPVDASGMCPQGCQMCLSGAGLELCQCDLPTCTPLPDGCNDCSCVDPPETGCTCEQAADGSIYIECISA